MAKIVRKKFYVDKVPKSANWARNRSFFGILIAIISLDISYFQEMIHESKISALTESERL